MATGDGAMGLCGEMAWVKKGRLETSAGVVCPMTFLC